MIENKQTNFVSVVVYVHNLEDLIYEFLEKIYGVLNSNFTDFEVICVNDASNDTSESKIRKFVADKKCSCIAIVQMADYQGKEFSMNAGVNAAIGDYVFEFESIYLDYDIHLLLDVYNKAFEGYDIVSLASENTQRNSTGMFYKILNKYSNSTQPIYPEVFRILSRRAINRVASLDNSIVYRKALYANCGLNTTTLFYKNDGSKRIFDQEEKKIRKRLAINTLIYYTDFFPMILLRLGSVGVFFDILFLLINLICKVSIFEDLFMLSFSWTLGFFVVALIIYYLYADIQLTLKKTQFLTKGIEKINVNEEID